ncbi:inositol monophosphatase family protein (plasmid) [Nitratireductor sp. GISD-1A_MAKvit]|uniref:inositol monophosphatase family protein n=1 Tax=Nitratireductor sp. GISD-1A_MAKvit TaxID=3234198 RepID=UPI0034677C67
MQTWQDLKDQSDSDIERVLFEIIKNVLPNAMCFGEETSPPFQTAEGVTAFLIDPVDGSHNRERGLPYYSVCIAQYDLGRVSCSMVFVPEWATLYLALEGRAYRSTPFGMDEIKVRAPVPPPDRAISVFKRQFLSGGNYPEKIRTISCSSIELCLVAQGALDAFVDQTGYEKQCDIAAALYILTAAGGHYHYDCPVDPLSGADPDWLRPRRLIAASQEVYLDEYSWNP